MNQLATSAKDFVRPATAYLTTYISLMRIRRQCEPRLQVCASTALILLTQIG